jgi:hypothetical protein
MTDLHDLNNLNLLNGYRNFLSEFFVEVYEYNLLSGFIAILKKVDPAL